jgi:hypothetical protein
MRPTLPDSYYILSALDGARGVAWEGVQREGRCVQLRNCALGVSFSPGFVSAYLHSDGFARLLMREAAFAHHSSIDEFKKAITQDGERPPIPADCITSLRELMTRCWDKDPNLVGDTLTHLLAFLSHCALVADNSGWRLPSFCSVPTSPRSATSSTKSASKQPFVTAMALLCGRSTSLRSA